MRARPGEKGSPPELPDTCDVVQDSPHPGRYDVSVGDNRKQGKRDEKDTTRNERRFHGADGNTTRKERPRRNGTSTAAHGYKRRFRPVSEHDRFTPGSRP